MSSCVGTDYTHPLSYFHSQVHYNDVIMGTMVSQITSLTIVYWTVYSGADQRKHQSSTSLGTGEFPAQMASNAENVSMWWCHHGPMGIHRGLKCFWTCRHKSCYYWLCKWIKCQILSHYHSIMSHSHDNDMFYYSDIIMSMMVSQITGVSIVCSTVCPKKTSKLCVTGLYEGNPPVTGGFPSQRASNMKNVSIWRHHHIMPNDSVRIGFPNSKVHGANMGLTWVLSAPDGPHVGPMNLAIRVVYIGSLVLNP